MSYTEISPKDAMAGDEYFAIGSQQWKVLTEQDIKDIQDRSPVCRIRRKITMEGETKTKQVLEDLRRRINAAQKDILQLFYGIDDYYLYRNKYIEYHAESLVELSKLIEHDIQYLKNERVKK